jgi:hypothetical protein
MLGETGTVRVSKGVSGGAVWGLFPALSSRCRLVRCRGGFCEGATLGGEGARVDREKPQLCGPGLWWGLVFVALCNLFEVKAVDAVSSFCINYAPLCS